MRIAIGAITLLFGIIAFGAAISNIHQGVGLEFMLGYFLPSGGTIVLGTAILAWRRNVKNHGKTS